MTDEVIERRASTFRSVDPYPDIEPALLNTADLIDYVAATGMIHPFRIDMSNPEASLKPASYAVPILGRFVYWEPDTRRSVDGGNAYRKVVGTLEEGEELPLRPNTITYVTLEPQFRLPAYIAARFNLKITDIYRGILVGTGPLVDPGFQGSLSVPLHNLTSNEYRLIGGERLVWMEFTKLSANPKAWRRAEPHEQPGRRGFYVRFPSTKTALRLDDYLRKAHPTAIVSSIPATAGQAQLAAERAQEQADTTARFVRRVGLGSALATAFALGAILVGTWNLLNDVNGRSTDSIDRVSRMEQQLETVQRDKATLANQVAVLQTAVDRLRNSKP